MNNLLLASDVFLLMVVLFLLRRDFQVRLARKHHKRLPR